MSIDEQNSVLLHFYKSTCGSISPAVNTTTTSSNSTSNLHSLLGHKPVETYTIHEVSVALFLVM